MFKVEIDMVGPAASGKTRLADKLAKFIKEEAGLTSGQAEITITEYTGHNFAVDKRYIRETKFNV